jgi:hypothetical protein
MPLSVRCITPYFDGMKYFLLSFDRRAWRKIALSTVVLASGVAQLLARPDPPAADRLMDPSKPENQGHHLLFRTDDDTTPPPAPTPSEQAFKDFKKGPATFAEFCQLYPLAGKPLGQDRLTIEVLATEVDASADASGPVEPTMAMLEAGNLIKQRMFANSEAQTENVLPLDRQSDGSKMPEPAWEGERLFTCLEQTDTGYTLAFTYAESRVESWAKASASTLMQPMMVQHEVNSTLPISFDGKWVAVSGNTREVPSDNGGLPRKLQTVVFVRLVKN